MFNYSIDIQTHVPLANRHDGQVIDAKKVLTEASAMENRGRTSRRDFLKTTAATAATAAAAAGVFAPKFTIASERQGRQ